MKHYYLVNSDYNNKTCKVINKFKSTHNACQHLEELTEEYIKLRMGKNVTYFDNHEENSAYWNSINDGYYLMKSKNSIYKIIIVHIYTDKGYIYDTKICKQLGHYEIVSYTRPQKYNRDSGCEFDFYDEYDKVIDELEDKKKRSAITYDDVIIEMQEYQKNNMS